MSSTPDMCFHFPLLNEYPAFERKVSIVTLRGLVPHSVGFLIYHFQAASHQCLSPVLWKGQLCHGNGL